MKKTKLLLITTAVLAAASVAVVPRLAPILLTDGDADNSSGSSSNKTSGPASGALSQAAFGHAGSAPQVHFAFLGGISRFSQHFDLLSNNFTFQSCPLPDGPGWGDGTNSDDQQSIWFATEPSESPAPADGGNSKLGQSSNVQYGPLGDGALLWTGLSSSSNNSSASQASASHSGDQQTFLYQSDTDQAIAAETTGGGTAGAGSPPSPGPTAVPIPAAFVLFGSALALLLGLGRRRQTSVFS
ncbi:hypothetical protein Thiosp_00547 [Thiorhodovibrio litoralis]|nr:hypothetical protein [Thiorhodovibrio winogradskyi]WPL10829.1 hypothetical protein Thiosp_00547 [Thiorhodovibrio litoralis]